MCDLQASNTGNMTLDCVFDSCFWYHVTVRMAQYLLCIGNTHDEQFGRKRERKRKFLVIPTLFQCLEGVA